MSRWARSAAAPASSSSGFSGKCNVDFPAETQRRRDKRREDTEMSVRPLGLSLPQSLAHSDPNLIRVLCAYLCVSASLRGIRLLVWRSEEHTSELQSLRHLVCR